MPRVSISIGARAARRRPPATWAVNATTSPSIRVSSPCWRTTPIGLGLPATIVDILSISSMQIVARSMAALSSSAVGRVADARARARCSTAASSRSGRNSRRSESTSRLALMIVMTRNGVVLRDLPVQPLDVVHDRRLAGARVADQQDVAGHLAGGVLVDRHRDVAQRRVLAEHAVPQLGEDLRRGDLLHRSKRRSLRCCRHIASNLVARARQDPPWYSNGQAPERGGTVGIRTPRRDLRPRTSGLRKDRPRVLHPPNHPTSGLSSPTHQVLSCLVL